MKKINHRESVNATLRAVIDGKITKVHIVEPTIWPNSPEFRRKEIRDTIIKSISQCK